MTLQTYEPELNVFGQPIVPAPADLGFPADRYPDWRSGQREPVQKILDWYDSPSQRKVLILEAPTGWGKSLIAAAVHRILQLREGSKYHGIITTATINLQRQYATDTLLELGRTAWGRAEHQCLVAPVAVDEGPCTHGFKCPRRKDCPYYAQRDLAHLAQIAVLNTAYWLTCVNYARLPGDLANETRNPGYSIDPARHPATLFDNADLVIHDEAHLLEGSLKSFIEARLSNRFFSDIGVRMPSMNEFASWEEWIASVWTDVKTRADEYNRAAARLAKEGETPHDPDGKRAVTAASALERISKELLPARPLIDRSDPQVTYFRAVWGAKFADEYLFKHARRHVLMSASIPDPSYLAETLGLQPQDWEFIRLPSLFHPARRRIIYHPTVKITGKSTKADFARLVERMDEYLDKHSNQKGIVHTVSYDRTKLVLELSRHRRRMISHGRKRGDKEMAIGRYVDSQDPVILVSPSVGVGEDFGRGDNCRFQFFVKYPIPNLGDPVVKARSEQNPKSLWVEADMAFIQAVGRGTRSEDDFSVSYVLDSGAGWRLAQLPNYIQEAIVTVAS